jgi:hypothetical protein
MILRFPHQVRIITPTVGGTDDYGNPVKTWATLDTVGFFQPQVGEEMTNRADYQIGDGLVYLPAGTAINGDCRVETLGKTYEVLGPPEVWQAGTTLDYVRAQLRVVEG